MKKVLVLFVVAMLLVLTVSAIAEEVVTNTVIGDAVETVEKESPLAMKFTVDLTSIFTAIISVLGSITLRYLVPILKQYRQTKWARIACYAAEQLFKNGEITDKLQYAIDFLEKHGIVADARVLIESTVGEFNEFKKAVTTEDE